MDVFHKTVDVFHGTSFQRTVSTKRPYVLAFDRKQQSNRLFLEGKSQLVILPNPDSRFKWTTERNSFKDVDLYSIK